MKGDLFLQHYGRNVDFFKKCIMSPDLSPLGDIPVLSEVASCPGIALASFAETVNTDEASDKGGTHNLQGGKNP